MTGPFTQEQVERITADLLDTDALTGNHDGTPEWYALDAENVEYLVRTVLGFLADRLPHTPPDQLADLIGGTVEHAWAFAAWPDDRHPKHGETAEVVDRAVAVQHRLQAKGVLPKTPEYDTLRFVRVGPTPWVPDSPPAAPEPRQDT